MSAAPVVRILRATPNLAQRELFHCVDALGDALAQDEPRFRVGEVLARLLATCTRSFREQERLMACVRYPEFEAHRRLHGDLVDVVQRMQHAFELRGASLERLTVFHAELRSWLEYHASGADRDFAGYTPPEPLAELSFSR